MLGYSLYHRHVPVHTAVATSAAGVVSLIPEGLVVLVSLTYAAAAVRMSRRGVLAQQLNAIESLASVDTICVDKTGTLTEATLRVVEILPASRRRRGATADGARRRSRRARRRATLTLQAIADAFPAQARRAARRGRRSRAAGAGARSRCAAATLYLGAPGRLPLGSLGDGRAGAPARGPARARRRCAAALPLPADPGERAAGGARAARARRARRGAAPRRARTRSRSCGARASRSRCSPAMRPRPSPRSRATSGIPVDVRQRRSGDPCRSRRAAQLRARRDRRRDASRRRASRRSCRRCAARGATSRWSATASTTCRR